MNQAPAQRGAISCLLRCVLRCVFFLCVVGLCHVAPLLLFAQSRTAGGLGGDTEKMFQLDAASLNAAATQTGSAFAMDNIVSPDHYFVGAGDVLALEIVGPIALTVPLAVSPENIVLVPRLGEINVEGKTLRQVKEEIQRLVQSRNPNNRAYLTLQRARQVYVRVSGNVLIPGLYTLPASMRVSSLVAIANQETASPSRERLTTNRTSTSSSSENAPFGQYTIAYWQRNVKVLHRNGTVQIADALRSRLQNDPSADPCLRESDEIYVPFEHEAVRDGAMLSVAGAVERPCLLPFRKGDRVSLLLKAAFGLSPQADSNRIELLETVSAGGAGMTAKTFTMARVLAGADDILLSAGASIVVREKTESTDSKRFGTVSVVGEVASPGVYSIEQARTRLSAIIKQAGGLTANAHLPLSTVQRREIKSLVFRPETGGISKNLQYTTLTPEDTLRYNLDESMRRPVVACDMAAALERNSEADNIVLQDGDVITIAANPRNIFVYGQVNKPGFIEASEGKTADWYLNAAGNFAPGADTARVRVIKAKNRLWLEPRITTGAAKGTSVLLEAGDQIYVPRVPDANTDLALKRVGAEFQKESLAVQRESVEAQKSAQIWQTIFGAISSATSVFFLGRTLGLW